MIKTKFDVTVIVDDKEFNISVSEPKRADKEVLSALSETRIEAFGARDSISAQLTQKREEYELNKQLLGEVGIVDRVKLLLEQKALNKDMYSLQAQLNEHDLKNIGIEKTIEELFKKRFELLIGGVDKEAFRSYAETHGVDYRELFVELGALVAEAKEKK